MDKKPSKTATTILEALDDLSAAVDGYASKLDQILDQIGYLNIRLVTVDDRLDRMSIEMREAFQEDIRNMESTVEDANARITEVADATASMKQDMPDIHEIVENMRREELNQIRFDARAAMGKVRFIQLRA